MNFRKSFFEIFSSPWTRWIGLRYLKSKKNSSFLSFITFISIAGVALGVTSLIVVLSVMDGFETELEKRLLATDLHILVQPSGNSGGFTDESSFALKFENKEELGIQEVNPVLATEVILKSARKTAGVFLKGVPERRFEKLKGQVVEFAEKQFLSERVGSEFNRLAEVYMGQELALDLGVIPGDRVTVISPTESDGPFDSVPRVKQFVVSGIYKSGVPDQEMHTLYSPVHHVESFLKKRNILSQWELSVKNFQNAPAIADQLRKQFPNLQFQDWIQMNSHLFYSLKLERVSMFIILAFIVVVASFNIVTTLTLMVLEKKREISILKAMGARHEQLGAVFLSEGIFIGLGGVGFGVGLGFLICLFLKNTNLIQLPDVYYDRTLPVTFAPGFYALVALTALLIVLLASTYPSLRAAKLHPLEGIRS